MTTLLYKDTRNYATIDAHKGIDLLTGEKVLADDNAPKGYEKMPKCRYCKNYKSNDEHLGTCGADGKDFMAYADMKAITCSDFID